MVIRLYIPTWSLPLVRSAFVRTSLQCSPFSEVLVAAVPVLICCHNNTYGIKQRNAVHVTRAKIVKSLEKIYHGGICFNDGTQQRFCLTEIRGDWKFQKETICFFLGGNFKIQHPNHKGSVG